MSDQTQGVSREDVIWCFEKLLGRPISDESSINHFVQTETNLKSLVNTISSSYEFRNNIALSRRPAVDRDGFNYDESLIVQKRVLEVLKSLAPKTVEGFNKIRVGAEGDGGYVMLDDFEHLDAAYSLGINDDVTWDSAIALHNIDIYQYDHTIDALPIRNDRFHWYKKGIASKKEGDLDTLPNLMRDNGHENSRELLLKCDIEGHEWDMLSHISTDQLAQFRQIVLETHGWSHMDREDFAINIEKSISNLTSSHSLIHVHANNCASFSIVGGVPLPAVMEMTFVRTCSYTLSTSVEIFPTILDAPCDRGRADFRLGNFRFC
jgi:hypothetical protein